MNTAAFNPRLARVFSLLALAAASFACHAASLDFDTVFNDIGEARHSHYLASYFLNQASQPGAQGAPVAHQVEVWRDADLRLKRRTDDSLETFVFKDAGQTEWRMVVLDLKRKIRTDIERTNLYRIGHFTNWFSLSHSLTRPVEKYQLIKISAPEGSEKPLAACQWYGLTRSGVESRICWSSKWRLPLLIMARDGKVQWRVTAADAHAIAASTYAIDDQGFVRNDANEDIKSD